MAHLEARGRLVRVREPVSPVLEITEIHTRLLAEQGPGGAVRECRGARHAGAHQPVRHGRAGRLGHEPRAAPAAGARRDAGLLQAAGAARELRPGVGAVAAGQGGAVDEAQDGGPRTLPGGGAEGRRHRSRPAADPDLLAGRAGAADHLAAGGDQGARRRARGRLQSRHLPHAGAGPRPDADALAQASRRRPAPPALGRQPQRIPCPPRR